MFTEACGKIPVRSDDVLRGSVFAVYGLVFAAAEHCGVIPVCFPAQLVHGKQCLTDAVKKQLDAGILQNDVLGNDVLRAQNIASVAFRRIADGKSRKRIRRREGQPHIRVGITRKIRCVGVFSVPELDDRAECAKRGGRRSERSLARAKNQTEGKNKNG